MKLVAPFLLIPFFCFSQGVKVNVYDNFIKKHRIELEPVTIYVTANSKMALSFSSIGDGLYVQLSGSGWGASTIDDGNEFIFLFSNDSTVTVRSTGLQTFEPGIRKSSYKHQYAISFSDLQALAKYDLTSVRKYSFKEFSDIILPKESRTKVQKLSALFLSEIKKAKLIKTLKQINVQDIAGHVGDSVAFCSKIYNTRYYQTSDNKPTVLDVQSNFTDPLVNVVILEEDRRHFPDMPEKVYLDKEACISGVVTMRNNIPQIVVRKREQIKIKSPVTLEDIGLFVDDTVTVSGVIYSAKYFSDSKTLPTLMNMGAPFPNQPLTVVIEKKDRDQFDVDPEVFYLNKEITVTGKVVLFKNKPQIVVRNKDQIKLLGDKGVVNTAGVVKQIQDNSKDKRLEEESVIQAQFPGGEEALAAYLKESLKAPEPLRVGEKKTVLASFFVDVDGSIRNIKIVQSAGQYFDAEVIRVLQLMPKWKPKTIGRLLMTETMTLPITFKGIEE